MIAYKIYTERNLADTSRDPDKFVYKQLGYITNIEDAIQLARTHIKKSFFRKDTKLQKGEGKIVFRALDSCSYGAEIIIEEIEIN